MSGGGGDGGSGATAGRGGGGGRGGVSGSGGASGDGGASGGGGMSGDAGVSGGGGGSGMDGGAGASGGSGGDGGDGGDGGSGGVGGSGGSSGTGGGGSGGGGGCMEPTVVTWQNPGFESGVLAPGWQPSGNYPQYTVVGASAARTGSFGCFFNDTGPGVPGVEQKIDVVPELLGRTVTVNAWVRRVTFPGALRLSIEANTAGGIHLLVELTDSDGTQYTWQSLTTQITVPATTDHLIVRIGTAVAVGDGVAYADDVQLCVDGLCTPCEN